MRTLMVLDPATQLISLYCGRKPLHTLVGHQGGVWCCAVQDDHIVSGSTDRTLRVWRLSSGEWLRTLSGHASTVRCVRIFGNHIVSGSRDSTVSCNLCALCLPMFHMLS